MSPMTGIELEKMQKEEDKIEMKEKEARELKEAKDKKEALQSRIRRVKHDTDKSQEVPESAVKSPPGLRDNGPTRVKSEGITPQTNYAEIEQMVERLKVCDFTFKSLLSLMGNEVDHQSPGLEQAMAILSGNKSRRELITKIVNSLSENSYETLEDLESSAVKLTDMLAKNYYIMDIIEYQKLKAKEASKAPKS